MPRLADRRHVVFGLYAREVALKRSKILRIP